MSVDAPVREAAAQFARLIANARRAAARGNPERALGLLEKAIRQGGGARAWVALGDTYRILGSAADARRAYEVALKLDPRAAGARAALAEIAAGLVSPVIK